MSGNAWPAAGPVSTNCRSCAGYGWQVAHGIGAPTTGTRPLHHPVPGAVRFAPASFQANGDPMLRLALYTRR